VSIIYEALQKVEKRPSFSRPRISPSPKTKKHNNKSLVVTLAVSITAAGLLYFLQARRITGSSGISENSPAFTSTAMPDDASPDKSIIKSLKIILPKPSSSQTDSKREMNSFNTKVYDGIEFTLSGILYSEEQPMAVINGKRVTVGDTVKEAKVTRIKEDSVELIFNNKKIILALY